MRLRLDHVRSVVGNDLTVVVEVEEGEAIAEVAIEYDDFDLARESLNPPVQSYTKSFRQQGDAAPGMEHRLVATAFDVGGKSATAVSEWTDET